jgi:hypothetical protein
VGIELGIGCVGVGWFERKDGKVGSMREERKANGGFGVHAVSLDVGL